MYSNGVILKIVNKEIGRVACNVCIPDVSLEDSYIIEDLVDSYKKIEDASGKHTKLEIFLEAISDGKVLQKADKDRKVKITTEVGKIAVDTLIDSIEELANKYHPHTLYKVDCALL